MNEPENLSKKSISTFVQLFVFLNSQNQQINVTFYKELCPSLYLKFVTKFKWAVIFPSLQRVLYHSWGVIEANEYCGICSGSVKKVWRQQTIWSCISVFMESTKHQPKPILQTPLNIVLHVKQAGWFQKNQIQELNGKFMLIVFVRFIS